MCTEAGTFGSTFVHIMRFYSTNRPPASSLEMELPLPGCRLRLVGGGRPPATSQREFSSHNWPPALWAPTIWWLFLNLTGVFLKYEMPTPLNRSNHRQPRDPPRAGTCHALCSIKVPEPGKWEHYLLWINLSIYKLLLKKESNTGTQRGRTCS